MLSHWKAFFLHKQSKFYYLCHKLTQDISYFALRKDVKPKTHNIMFKLIFCTICFFAFLNEIFKQKY